MMRVLKLGFYFKNQVKKSGKYQGKKNSKIGIQNAMLRDEIINELKKTSQPSHNISQTASAQDFILLHT